jgi:uncharacterized protein
MTSHEFDPLLLDVAAFATEATPQEGVWPLAQLPRLAEVHCVGEGVAPAVKWRLQGERRAARNGKAEIWLHIEANTALQLQCQRCLEPVDAAVNAQKSFLFVAGDAAAAQLDNEMEDDVLALTRTLDARELLEDELLLSLPTVPRHSSCVAPLPQTAEADQVENASLHPFAALAALKKNDTGEVG